LIKRYNILQRAISSIEDDNSLWASNVTREYKTVTDYYTTNMKPFINEEFDLFLIDKNFFDGTQVNGNDFRLLTSQIAKIQDLGTATYTAFYAEEYRGLNYHLVAEIQERKNNSSVDTGLKTVIGLRENFNWRGFSSVGVGLSNLSNQTFRVENDGATQKAIANDHKISIEPAVFYHWSPIRQGTVMPWALALGVGISTEANTRAYLGASIRLGRQAMLTAGISVGGVRVTKKDIDVNKVPQNVDSDSLTTAATKASGFFSISFNLGN